MDWNQISGRTAGSLAGLSRVAHYYPSLPKYDEAVQLVCNYRRYGYHTKAEMICNSGCIQATGAKAARIWQEEYPRIS